jgi:small subunit ribosomal protein S1
MSDMYNFDKCKVGQIIEGKVLEVTDNRVLVDFGYFTEGIMYLNELTTKEVLSAKEVVSVGDTIKAKIKKMTDEEIFLSRLPIEREESLKDIKDIFNKRSFVDAVVKKDLKSALIVSLQGHDAVLPKSEIDVDAEFDAETLINKTIKVKIIELETRGKARIVVSRKAVQLFELYQERIANFKSIELGATYEGEITRVEGYGVLVTANNYQGLVPLREISHLPINNIQEEIKVGDKVNVKVININEDKLQILYSIKRLLLKPWEVAEQEINEGDVIEGTIVRTTDFGAFVNVFPLVDGLLHVSEYSHNPNVNMFDVVEVGQKIEVKVLSMDLNRERLSLSVKALKEDPWKSCGLKRYDIVQMTVIGYDNNDAVVEFMEDVVGFLPKNQISSEKRVSNASDELPIGKVIDVKVTDFDAFNHRLSVSIRRILEDEERQEYKKVLKEQDKMKNDTLGDILGDKLRQILDK